MAKFEVSFAVRCIVDAADEDAAVELAYRELNERALSEELIFPENALAVIEQLD